LSAAASSARMPSSRNGFTCSPYELACLLQPEFGIAFTIGLVIRP
jgi:hypothetical protein